jgi:hypothetical protein
MILITNSICKCKEKSYSYSGRRPALVLLLEKALLLDSISFTTDLLDLDESSTSTALLSTSTKNESNSSLKRSTANGQTHF